MKKWIFALMVLFGLGTVTAQCKLGHVDTQKLLDTMPSRKIVEAEILKSEQEGYDELQVMYNDLQASIAKYQNEKPNMNSMKIQIEEEKITKKEQAIQLRSQEIEDELRRYSESLQQPMYERIKKAVKIVAERKKLNYVLNNQEFVMLLYADEVYSITDEVIVELLLLEAAETN
jgi:outer membrane protein